MTDTPIPAEKVAAALNLLGTSLDENVITVIDGKDARIKEYVRDGNGNILADLEDVSRPMTRTAIHPIDYRNAHTTGPVPPVETAASEVEA